MYKLDPKLRLDIEVPIVAHLLPIVRDQFRAPIEALTRTNITFGVEPPESGMYYRLNLNIANGEAFRQRLLKENAELEKVIANSDRQLSNEGIIGKMPAHVAETLRAKNASYKAQLQKNLDALANE